MFLVFANMNMLANLYLFKLKTSERLPVPQFISTSYTYKTNCYILQILLMISASYFYYRHNTYCEAGVYSFFALSEYLLVAANIAFHYTSIFDFQNAVLTFTFDTV